MLPTKPTAVVSEDHPEQDEIVESWLSLEGVGAAEPGYTLMGQSWHRDVPRLSAQGWRPGAKLRVERTQQGVPRLSSARDLKP